MTLQTVLVRLATVPAGANDLGDGSDLTGVETVVPAADGAAELPLTAFGSSFTTGETIKAVALRFRLAASADGFLTTPVWSTSADRLKWRTGGSTASYAPVGTAIPKDGLYAWCEPVSLATPIFTQPDGASAWTAASINALELSARVQWAPAGAGSVTLSLVEAEVVVYVERDADVRGTAVGQGTLPSRKVGGALRDVVVGQGTLPTRWVGED